MSQHSGNISITSHGVKLIEDEVSITKELGNLSENLGKKIPKNLIQECDDKYETTGIPHLILDASDNYKIRKSYYKEEKRDLSLDYLLVDTKFEVVSWYELMEMPSRDTFYDSVTKHTDLFERHKKVLTFLNGLDFFITDLLESGISQQELLFNSFNREISYTSEYLRNSIIRVKPNLLIEMLISPTKDSVEIHKKYRFFYDPKRISEIVIENSDSENSRNLKLKQIL